MIKVYKSDAGQFVLMHPASQTFIIDESLEGGMARLETHLRERHPEMAGRILDAAEPPPSNRAANSRIAQLALLVALALLPFIWLLVMQHSVATLLSEFRFAETAPSSAHFEEYAALRQEVDRLRVEFHRVLEALHSLNLQVAGLKEAAQADPDAADSPPEAAAPEEEASQEAGIDPGGGADPAGEAAP